MREEEALASLETLGLTRKEARAYIAIVRSGLSTARDVSGVLGMQYPAVYRVLHALEAKGWIEKGRERPSRYRARNPRVVAEEARQTRADALARAATAAEGLVDDMDSKARSTEADLVLYKGPEGVAKKLREIVLGGDAPLLVVSPLAVDRDVLRLVFASLRGGPRGAKVVLNEGNQLDVQALRPLLRKGVRVALRFPASPHPGTRLAHTFVFPSDRELLILNSFYRDGVLVPERLQGLWIGDADYVRLQLEAMMKGLQRIRGLPRRRVLPMGGERRPSGP